MSPLELIATILGLLGVGLMVRRRLWAFPVGLVQVALFGWVCFQAKLYSETALQGLFFVALAHGWWHWTHPAAGRPERPVTRLSGPARLGWGAATVVVWLGWGALMARTDAALPFADAFVFAVSAASQWLQARKHVENWPGWIAANVVGIGVFVAKDLPLFAGLYAVFLVLAIWGWRDWSRAARAEAAP